MLVAAYYLIGGTAALLLWDRAMQLSPWSMGVLFGGGQLLSAAVLWLTLERSERTIAVEE